MLHNVMAAFSSYWMTCYPVLEAMLLVSLHTKYSEHVLQAIHFVKTPFLFCIVCFTAFSGGSLYIWNSVDGLRAPLDRFLAHYYISVNWHLSH